MPQVLYLEAYFIYKLRQMKIKISLLLGFFVVLLGFAAFKLDDDPFTQLLKKLEDYSAKYPQEKVYLHLDKPYYAIGDDIWFKAYTVNTKTLEPSQISKILYVELINEKDSLKRLIKLPIIGGITWGDLKLIDSLGEGNYRIRAYTNYMRNFGTDFFFDKNIKIGNGWANKVFTFTQYTFSKENSADKVNATIKFEDKDGTPYKNNEVNYEVQLDYRTVAKGKATTNDAGEASVSFTNNQSFLNKKGKIVATITLDNKQKIVKSIPITSTSNDVDVQFLPEGGAMVEELPQKIAIKAINGAGLGEDIKAKIVDDTGFEVMSLATTHLGMGSFVLNMQPNKAYTAKVTFKDGSQKDFKLPLALKSGNALSVNNLDTGKVTVKIMTSADRINGDELKIVAQQGGNIYYVSKAKVDKQLLTATISKSKLPAGIIQFTLFSNDNTPIAERLIFNKNRGDIIDLKVNSAEVSNLKRGKSTISFNASNKQQPLIGSFSVAVTNTNKVAPDENNESNIFANLLLTSDLAGFVEKPNYYFLKDDVTTSKNLDDLLLTHGWRRFLWRNVINNVGPALTYKAEQSTSISGTVTKGGKPVPNGKVMIMATKGGLFIQDTITNAEGKFSFDNLEFNDSVRFVVQARTKTDRKFVEIKLDAVPNQIITKSKNGAEIDVNVNNTLMKYIKESDNYFNEMTRLGLLERTIKLNEVTVTEQRNPAKNSANLNGAGRADFIITAKDLSACVMLSQCLNGRIPFVIWRNGIPYSTRSQNTPMAVVVDGMNVEPDFLDILNANDVETIEVLRTPANTAIYGSRGAGGVLIVTTKRGGSDNLASVYAPGVVTVNQKGFSISREFYAPKYDDATNSTRADYRSTIYWNPQVVSDKEGKASFSFYNADEPGTYRMVIEGIDAEGHFARSVSTFDVK